MRVVTFHDSRGPRVTKWLNNVCTLICAFTFVISPTQGRGQSQGDFDLYSKGYVSSRIPQDYSWRRHPSPRTQKEHKQVTRLKDAMFSPWESPSSARYSKLSVSSHQWPLPAEDRNLTWRSLNQPKSGGEMGRLHSMSSRRHQSRSAVDSKTLHWPTLLEPTSAKKPNYRSFTNERQTLPAGYDRSKKPDFRRSRAQTWSDRGRINQRVNVRSLPKSATPDHTVPKRRKGNLSHQRNIGTTRLNVNSMNKYSHRPSQAPLYQGQVLDRSHFMPTHERHSYKGRSAQLSSKEASPYSATEFEVPPSPQKPQAEHLKDKRANIILIVTDDLDVELGSLNYMPRLLRVMADGGALFPNAYTTTPMCCPSRSSMLTGMYIHNHQVFTNHQNCSSPLWQNTHERRSFASYLSNAGYKTGYFGKYLNRYNGSHVPSGWQEWGALLMNSRYYNYTVNRNNHHVKYGNRYPHDYYPHVITNDGLRFMKESKGASSPFLLVLSYPSPHGPEDSAPEHAHKFFNASDHHTASYNYAPNPDKQWMLQFTDRMPDIQLKYSDLLMTKRLQTLQTVDSAVEKIVKGIEEIGQTDNTYVFFTSDHGYHLGQFGLAKGKSMPFEFDIKVPFLVRGPGITPGVDLPQIALNIDLAPTFLDIGGVPRPSQMDGRSLLPVFRGFPTTKNTKDELWRDSFLVESSGRLREEEELEKKEQRTWERERALAMTLMKAKSNFGENGTGSLDQDRTEGINHVSLYTSKHEKLEEVCQRDEFSVPCKETQKWHCLKIGSRWKIKKCRHGANKSTIWQKHCICHFMQGFGTYRKLDVRERRMQRNFLKKYVTKDFREIDPKFIKAFKNIHIPLHYGFSTNRDHENARINKRKRNGRSRYRRSVEELKINESYLIPFPFGLKNHSKFIEQETFEEGMTIEELPDGNALNISDTDHSLPRIDYAEEGRSNDGTEGDSPISHTLEDDSIQNLGIHEELPDESVHDFVEEEELRDLKDQIHDIADEIQSLESVTSSSSDPANSEAISPSGSPQHGCHASQGHINCQDEVYRNMSAWTNSKVAIEDHMRRLRQQLHVMKNIMRHLQAKKPNLFNGYDTIDYDSLEEESHDSGSNFYNESNYGEILKNQTTIAQQGKKAEISEDIAQDLASTLEEEDVVFPAVTSSFPIVGLQTNQAILPEMEPGTEGGMDSSPRKPKKSNSRHGAVFAYSRGGHGTRDDYLDNENYEENNQHGPQGGGKFYYPITFPNDNENTSGNEALHNRLCWCDKKVIQKMVIQQAREKKRVERQKIKEKRQHRKLKKKRKKNIYVSCNYSTLNCYTHDNDHWKTPPLWTDGQFCFCLNSANNTYWCLRTINETHNFLYCEFITGLITYYDLHIDPYQLRNVAFTLSNERVLELNEKLTNLRSCRGADECDGRLHTKEKNLPQKKTDGFGKQNFSRKYPYNSTFLNIYDRSRKASFKRKKAKKLQKKQEKKRYRKERRKYKNSGRFSGSIDTISENPFNDFEEFQANIRIPRKSRHNKQGKKQRRRERKRLKRKREKERRRLSKSLNKISSFSSH